ncbi:MULTISPECIES: DUF4761 domain-containing protein [Klebsiella]|uniref:DUF4761 domain-containing protein n=1 Tax=Klebsiella michiganensis TaxID=1134687 RepID=A0AB35WDU1_9ENTR|nr:MULTISPECIES: DUF4761 domain-containing protein [Klebsiella]MDK3149095.1 DUF4761 domain-containing protein [Klebsiella michiganensis]MDO3486947.1 DUF4761 domain-containing protein [Klebsiella pneumoniae]MDO3497463.1 DUF4761 domain-containing protein [Klebsiella pneumoniae]MDO3503921.1 DUF4761 domain-containing protein [Klebsiella pneumoniae]MDS7809841.1 DUF4761 domain-containing protein [Klebsiella michiganensis]
MNKRYLQHGKCAGNIRVRSHDNLPKVVWINKHAGICCGFTIRVLPRRVGKKRYQIMKDGDSFGIDFALSEARKTIDRIINNNRFTIH